MLALQLKENILTVVMQRPFVLSFPVAFNRRRLLYHMCIMCTEMTNGVDKYLSMKIYKSSEIVSNTRCILFVLYTNSLLNNI